MKKIDLYIIRKFLGTFFLSMSLIIIIVVIFDLSENIDDLIETRAPLSGIIFDYYLNFIPYFVNLFSPLFTFIAVVFFTSQMATRTEIVAILGGGISFRRMLVPYLIGALFLTVMSFYLANFLIPLTNKNMLAFKNTYIRNKYHNTNTNIHMQISPGTFIYVQRYSVETNTGYNFTMEKFNSGSMFYKMNAARIIYDSSTSRWTINDYSIRLVNGMQERLVFGRKMDTALNLTPGDFYRKDDNMDVMNFSQLRTFIDEEKMKGSDNIRLYEVEKHRRIAFPFASIVLTIIGVSVSSRKVRGGIGLHIAFGMAITFSFVLFLRVTETFATYGNLPPFLAVWLPNVVYGLLGLYLLRIAPK
ncbi:MAG: LptF/LptG family permease [Bacteroidota bacterium]